MEWRAQESVNGRHAEGRVHEEHLNIEVCKIVVPEGRMRPVNAARVEELQDSIGKGQLLQPLVVRVPNAHKQWPLVDGAHRLAR